MKVYNLKSIHLKPVELKETIIQHLWRCGQEELARHLNLNECSMEWNSGGNFVISIDGETEE